MSAPSKKLLDALLRHVVHDDALSGAPLIELRALLRDGSSRLVHAPPQELVFRGMTVTKAWLTKLVGERVGANGRASLRGKVFGSESKASSWTTARSRAPGFFFVDARQNLRNVILTASVRGNRGAFVACSGGLYGFPDLSTARLRKEREVLAVRPVHLVSVEWSDHDEWYQKLKASLR